MAHKNTICIWYDNGALEAATFYASLLPDSAVTAVHHAPGDYPDGKEGNVLTVEFTVCGIPCVGLNGGTAFKHSEAFSFQIQTEDQAETTAVGRHRQQRRTGEPVRLVQGPMGHFLADQPTHVDRSGDQPGQGTGQARLQRDDADEEDRHRHHRSGNQKGTEGLSRFFPCAQMRIAT